MRNYLILLILGFTLTTCLDPTAPSFQLEDSFYLVEGRLLVGEEGSEIRIRESAFREENKQFNPVPNARVVSLEAGGAAVEWMAVPEEEGLYRPPNGFSVVVGETWSVEATLPDGTRIVSDAETAPEPVALTDVRVIFEQNSIFESGLNRFIPRFEIFVDYDDPAGEENFYAYDYRYFEEVIICAFCERGFWRQGECFEDLSVFRYDYLCDTEDCFKETPGNQTVYGNDDLSDGSSIDAFPLGGINFQAYGGLLVEGILLSITKEAYDYGKVIQDLTTGNNGLNATIPAALNGNVRNTDPTGRTVLGYVGVASASRKRTYLERLSTIGTPLPFDPVLRLEPSVGPFVPPRAPCEVDGRMAVRPEGWGG